MPTKDHTTTAPVFNRQNPATWLKPEEPLIGADGRDWSWAYVWHKDVEGFPGYKIGSDGSVWTCRVVVASRARYGGFKWVESPYWTPMAASRQWRGHRAIGLRRTGEAKQRMSLHVLVLEHFWGPSPPGMICRHLDGDPANNNLRNLAWGTQLENSQDSRRHGTIAQGSRHGKSKLTEADIPAIRRLRREGESFSAIGRRFSVSGSNIASVCRGETWSHVPG